MVVGRASAYSLLSIRLAAFGERVATFSPLQLRVVRERLPEGDIKNEIESLERSAVVRCALKVVAYARTLATPSVERQPELFYRDYQQILTTLSNRFDESGDLRRGYETMRECEAIYHWVRHGSDRAAVEARSAAGAPDHDTLDSAHATTLMNLSNRCGSLFRHRTDLSDGERLSLAEEALRYINDAVEIRRRLFESHPDAHRLRLAIALSNRAVRFSDFERHQESVDTKTI